MSSTSHDFIDPEILARLSAQGLHARQPMLGNVSGKHRSPVRGSSLEFAQYRKYVPGDDTRRMDWRAWGRSDRFYIKEFEADTNLRLCLIVDTSGSMNYELDGNSKFAQMRSIAGTLAYLASRQGDAVGLYCARERFHKEIRPRRGAAHLRVVLDTLAEVEAQGPTGLADALHEAAENIPQRALIVVVSDLFLQPDVLQSCFQHLRFRKHDVSVFHLLDNSEIEFDFRRPVRFVDLEGGDSILTDPSIMGGEYHRAITQYLDELNIVMREAAVDYHQVSLNDPVEEILARFLMRRQPKRRAR